MDIQSFLLINLLNAVTSIILFPIGILIVMLSIKIVHYMTPYDLKGIFEKGVSGGAVILASAFLGISLIIAASSF